MLNFEDLRLGGLDLGDGNGEYAALHGGVSLVREHIHGQDDGAGEPTPVALLREVVVIVNVMVSVPCAANGDEVVANGHVQVFGLHAGDCGLDDDVVKRLVHVDRELAIVALLQPVLGGRWGATVVTSTFLVAIFRSMVGKL